MSRLLRAVGVQAGEGPLAAGLFGYSLLLGVGRVFVLTASQALFLQFYPASDLAYVYMLAAAATIATSAAYLRLGRRLSPRDLILGNLAFTVLVTAGLRLVIGSTDAGWPAMAIAAWFHVLFALSSFAFWGAATQLVDIRQGKRLFPLATTGDVLAFSLGGVFILRSVDRLGTANLLWIGAAGFALAMGALFYAIARSPARLDRGTARSDRKEREPIRWSSPYLRLMMGYFVLSAVVFVFLDNAFNDVAQRRFEGTAELARFFATYSAVAAVVNFVFRSLLAGRLVRRFGLVFGLAVLPAIVGLGAITIGLAGTLLPGLAVVFWMTVLTRMSDKVLRGVQYASMATLYQPLGDRGPSVQATMDGIIDSVAIGLAGVAILGLNALIEVTAVELAWFLVALCLAWVAVSVALKREFVGVLGGTLQHRRLGGEGFDILDDTALAIVRAQLESERPEEVLYALDLFIRADPSDLGRALERLLESDAEEIRLEALRLLVERDAFTAERLESIARDGEAPTRLRAAAIRALAERSEEISGSVRDALASDAPDLRRGAMVGLLRSGSIEGIVQAGAALLADLRSDDPKSRAFGAAVLRDARISSFHRQVSALLEDPDPGVRIRAVEAAGAIDDPRLWPRVVDALGEPALLDSASKVLLDAGRAALPHLMAGYSRAGGDRELRLSILRIVGLLRDAEVTGALLPLLATPVREERSAVLVALLRSPPALDPALETELGTRLETELEQTGEAYAALSDLEAPGPGTDTRAAEALRGALRDEIRGGVERVFRLLALLKPEADLVAAWQNYDSGSRDRRAYALELLDGHLRTAERARVFPVLEDLELDERLAALRRTRELSSLSPAERVTRLGSDPELSSWTRLCARRLAASLHPALESIPPSEARLFDRTTRLGAVELFRDLPGTALARVVPKLGDATLEPGTTVIHKGEPGDRMYVVLEGRVRVHDGERELAVLGPDTVFGEFTVLQRAPRTASVTAVERSVLLELDQDHLHELMRDNVGVARRLIRVILRRLRENREAAGTA